MFEPAGTSMHGGSWVGRPLSGVLRKTGPSVNCLTGKWPGRGGGNNNGWTDYSTAPGCRQRSLLCRSAGGRMTVYSLCAE